MEQDQESAGGSSIEAAKLEAAMHLVFGATDEKDLAIRRKQAAKILAMRDDEVQALMQEPAQPEGDILRNMR